MKRYWAGKAPEWAPKEDSEEEAEQGQLGQGGVWQKLLESSFTTFANSRLLTLVS